MPTEKVIVYTAIHLDMQGKVTSVAVTSYHLIPTISHDHGYITLPLGTIEIDVEIPDGKELNERTLALLRESRDKLRAEHTALMTKYQYLENQLLGLPAPDIVGGERRRYDEQPVEDVTPRAPKENDDDIPF